MQRFPAVIYLCLLLAAGCGGGAVVLPPPTSIFEGDAALAATPTLLPENVPDGAVAAPISDRSIGDPYIPELGNLGIDVQRYTLQLELDPASLEIRGTASLDFIITQPDLTELSLDFVGFEVTAVRLNGTAVGFRREGKKLLIPFTPLSPLSLTLAVDYEGQPLREPSRFVGFNDGLGWQNVDGRYLFTVTEPDGARYWFPANDHPRDKAEFRFELTVPAGQTAVANGRLLAAEIEGDQATFIWEHNFPMAPYLAVVAVGEYERLDGRTANGIPLRHYITQKSRADFERVTAVTGPALDWMSQQFGPYPFEVFGFVVADTPGASLETQTMVLLARDLVGARTAVHELAHMWFGNWVSLDSWADMWFKEGLATYIEMMWRYRDDPEGLEFEIAGVETAVAQYSPQYPIGNPPPEHLLGLNTYLKGAALFHELRQTVGDAAFFGGLSQFVVEFGGQTASAADFQAIMETQSGLSLDAFFAEWLN